MLQDIEIDCGDSCERHIDGVWYTAKVISVDGDTVSIMYDDDGKTESEIPKFDDDIRYSKFPDFKSVGDISEANDVLDAPSIVSNQEEYLGSDKNVKTSMQRNLSTYRLDYNQLTYIFGRTSIPLCKVSRPTVLCRSKSFDSYLRRDSIVKVFMCSKAGHLFAYRPVERRPEISSARTCTDHSSWGRTYVNLLPLADLCVACRAVTTFKCGRCNDTFYCSKACQKMNWAHHKVFCEPKPLRPLFRLNPELIIARPRKMVRCNTAATSVLAGKECGVRTPNNLTDRYSGRNEATDAAFGRDAGSSSGSGSGGATRRLWDKSTNAVGTSTVPLFDVRNANAAIPTLIPSSSSSNSISGSCGGGGGTSRFLKISEAGDDLDEHSGIHGHLRTATLSSQSRSSHASRDTQPEQWDYSSAYQKGIMPNSLAEEFGYGTSTVVGAGGRREGTIGSELSPLNLPTGAGSRATASYEPVHSISAHSSSNSMITQDVISHSNSPAVCIDARGEVIDIPDDEDEMEKFRRAVTPTKHHLRSLDTLSISGFRRNGVGNPFVVNQKPGGVVSEDDYGLDEDDDDDMPTLAVVAPAPPMGSAAAAALPREGGSSPATLFAKPFAQRNVTMAANTTPVRSSTARPIEVIDLQLEAQIKNLVMELGLNEKSLRMALKIFPGDLDRAVEWVYDNGGDFDEESQWM